MLARNFTLLGNGTSVYQLSVNWKLVPGPPTAAVEGSPTAICTVACWLASATVKLDPPEVRGSIAVLG
jgi:hypothetical protein